MLMLLFSAMILGGIWLTGFDQVHWLLYLPAAALAFGGLTGACPGLILLHKLGFKNEPVACSIGKG
ncbi:MAG: hypothetical protein A2286_11505 [Gammaproteobacteria bacterium RIFOXYA12_FULL_61_12]|nr:MAG: hypothetical protein A2514_09665 [Gammaproteobacteria bacterium RIFOXYD12_FULL_61_37]OGT94502.1 MAG: hypothetical protein A2286_11505 [Gammaproteobacteria bacterium RIFOXYA12_FULL_61_12]